LGLIHRGGFPIASEGDFAAVKAVAGECRKATVAALCRTSEQDVLRAAAALEHAAHPRYTRLSPLPTFILNTTEKEPL